MKYIIFLLFVMFSILSCSKIYNSEPDNRNTMYFPPNTGDEWDTIPSSDLKWNDNAVADLKAYLVLKNTKSFMILVNGRIAMEAYFNGHDADTEWEWNSAGKTLVSAMTGIAQNEGLLSINDRSSQYLGTGWTNMSESKENLITVKHLLTMTSGIDDTKQWVNKSNLIYTADAGSRWAYGNVFQKLTEVVAKASNKDFESYFNEKLKNRIGMDGYWNFGKIFTIYHSSTRSMARFGLMSLNKGKWNNEQVVDGQFFNAGINTSQDINPAYGYLWWLNGKSKYMLPGSQNVFQGTLIPNAPSDMYAAMGALDQRIYVIPSRNMVIVRMGKASNPDNPNFAVSGFDNEFWSKINAVIH